MHLHHDTRPGLWHAVFGFGAGFGARARAGLGEQRQFTPCCLVALSPVLCGTLDAPRQQPFVMAAAAAHDGTRSWPRGVQPHVAVSLLRPCTPAANGRTRTCSRNYYFPFPHTNMLHVIGRGGRVGSQLRIFKQALRLSRGARGALKTHLRLSRGTRTGPRNPDVSG